MKKSYPIFIAMVLCVVMFGCNNKAPGIVDELIEEDTIVLNPEELVKVAAAGGDTKITVLAGSGWNASIYVEDPMLNQYPDWISLTEKSGSASDEAVDFNIVCSNNLGLGKRTATIVFILDINTEEKHFITVEQEGADVGSKVNAYISSRVVVGNRYPETSGDKVTVQSQIHGLWFFGWSVDTDKKFTMNFPASTDEFNRIIMTYRMGGGPDGCSGYDHLTTMAFKYDNQWWEIARVVTPFGNSFDSKFEKKYYFDVTEYLPMLKGATEFKLYFNGFDASATGRHHTAQVTFDMYKGARAKSQIFAQKLYDSEKNQNSGYRSFMYGVGSKSIESAERMGSRSVAVPAGVKSLKMKVVISGHGHDQGKFLDRPSYSTRNAAEFDENFYTLKLDNAPCQQRGVIFIPCGRNYAQSGTAYYDRANWCPGNPVRIDVWEFVNIPENGGTFDLDIDFDRFETEYTNQDNGSAAYGVSVDIFGFDN